MNMKVIKEKNTLIFENVQDYDLPSTFNCGQCFRWDAAADGWQGFAGIYPCFIHFIENDLYVQCLVPVEDMSGFADYMVHYLSLDMDYAALKRRFSADRVMKSAIDYAPGIRVLNQPFFETLLTFIISRNNNIPRIKKIVDAMAATYGTKVGDMYAFPTAEQLKDVTVEQYSELRMGFRAKYIFDAVQKVLAGEIDETTVKSLPYADAQKYLMKIKGVGPKVADCVLLFSCRQYESFPKDVWINRALAQMFPQGLPECIKGMEGIAQQYIFQYARFNLEK
ncbi:MAG: DNA-3-methyladenine glycosylase 2 family protein [Oscillospiraceae bacterium]|nr:DNA-3-methyladenine glycosylase 2 family protein [Oscillospiraceae bacterium]